MQFISCLLTFWVNSQVASNRTSHRANEKKNDEDDGDVDDRGGDDDDIVMVIINK